MSKERQKRRAEREAAALAVAEQQAAAAERRVRKDARRERLTGWVPRPAARPGGVLAEKRRRQAGFTLAVLVAFNLLVYAFTQDWYVTGLTVVASVLGAPIVHMILTRKG
ncbi:MAG TPA: hypothetical protein VFV89_05550 [Nocardioides sp.]|uniref:hypothetical protein n=1 Tax=Nocardioides sp. TaxID=35761 RepID=UPI002E3420EC|nr:hypothetical protein [Nocardioides sp.]HEX5087252.1 hypothetical protein [Nocardioides sp.]